jgi:sporulation protein YlmC with PRC-barrel domain
MPHRPARPKPCLAPPLAVAVLAPALLAAALVLPAGSAATQEVAPADAPLQVSARTVSFHSMLELDVLTADAENLGGVYDIVADPTDGLLKFLVVERTEDILGIFRTAETRVAVPWHRVSLIDSPRQFVLDMTVEEFERLPTWEGERTEAGGVGAAPIDERPDQAPLVTD